MRTEQLRRGARAGALVGNRDGNLVEKNLDVDLDGEGRVVERPALRGVAATQDDDLQRASATGELIDAEKLGCQGAAELLDLGAGALGGGPASRGPGRSQRETSK